MIFLNPDGHRAAIWVATILAAASMTLVAVAPESAEAATVQAGPAVVYPTAVHPVAATVERVHKAKADGPHVEVPELDWPVLASGDLHQPVRARMASQGLHGRAYHSAPVPAPVPALPSYRRGPIRAMLPREFMGQRGRVLHSGPASVLR